MIVASIGTPCTDTLQAALKRLHGVPVEIRFDRMEPAPDPLTIERLLDHDAPVIAAYHLSSHRRNSGKEGTEREALRILRNALEAGADSIDIDHGLLIDTAGRAPAILRAGRRLLKDAQSAGCTVIVSYHDLERTPSTAALQSVRDTMFETGADIVKIATRVSEPCENARLLALLDDPRQRSVVVVGMGAMGRITRLAAPLCGAPLTYGYPAQCKTDPTAPGQFSYRALCALMERVTDD